MAIGDAFISKTDADGAHPSDVTTMVVKDHKSKRVFPVPAPQKPVGPENYAVRQLLEVQDCLGCWEVSLMCDQESVLAKC